MTSMDMSQYLGAFLDEAGDNLKHLDDLTLAIGKDPETRRDRRDIPVSPHPEGCRPPWASTEWPH